MKHHIVIGLGFGDEGKGTVVDYLCSKNPSSLVVRFNGGHQAGHTVYLNDVHHMFSSFGSGTMRGIPTYWSKYCPVEPFALMNEYNALLSIKSKEFPKYIHPRLFIDPECPITTPYDINSNIAFDSYNKHGSCGVGVGKTMQREESHYHLQCKDILYPKIFDIRLNMIKQYYNVDLELEQFYEAVKFIKNTTAIKIKSIDINYCDMIIWEGAQGLMLDKDNGFFPHVTYGNAGIDNIKDIINKAELYLVTRAYQTRHGNGPMTNEELPHNIKDNPYESNNNNDRQGKFRSTILDLDLIEYAINSSKFIKNSKNKILAITCLDIVENAYSFTYNGQLEHFSNEYEFINKISKTLKIKKIMINNSPQSNTFKSYDHREAT